jgi:hypothetical protein
MGNRHETGRRGAVLAAIGSRLCPTTLPANSEDANADANADAGRDAQTVYLILPSRSPQESPVTRPLVRSDVPSQVSPSRWGAPTCLIGERLID